ncbi:MAG: hypothetical protein MN733_20300 [Nitrososphaera sp.]|nr:hypothetical protein [Nitrososphaera sp.]
MVTTINNVREWIRYGEYFPALELSFSLLLKGLTLGENGSGGKANEVKVTEHFLERMLGSLRALGKKYRYNPNRDFGVYFNSGFPTALEITHLAVDLELKQEKLAILPSETMLKETMLDEMLGKGEDPKEALWQMSQVQYYGSLDPKTLMLPFVPGTLELLSDREGAKRREYLFSWACYDFVTNRPYIHLLVFEHDKKEGPLTEGTLGFDSLLDVIRSEGSRVPELIILATQIDELLGAIHPKFLKRTAIGPFFWNGFSVEDDPLGSLLREHGSDNDFILLWRDEILFSTQEEAVGLIFKKARQIFHIPETDAECYKGRVSCLHRFMLAPHSVLQHLPTYPAAEEIRARYKERKLYSYNNAKGEVYDV